MLLLRNKYIQRSYVLQKLSFSFTYKSSGVSMNMLWPDSLRIFNRLYLYALVHFSNNLNVSFFHVYASILPLLNTCSSINQTFDGFFNFFIINRNSIERKQCFLFFKEIKQAFVSFVKQQTLSWFSDIFLIGVGYKVYIYKTFLYLRLGFSKMLKVPIPRNIFVFTRYRNHLLIFSDSAVHLNSFTSLLKNLRAFDCYKGKGIYGFDNFEGIRLKVGKKQQFF